jgi:pyridoxine 4-dehydrogenase
MSLRRLGVERIDLWQLHRIDAAVPRDEQFGVLAEMQREGLIRHVGLSQVSVEEIEAALEVLPIATVQNLYHLARRDSEDVVALCEAHGDRLHPVVPARGRHARAPRRAARPGGGEPARATARSRSRGCCARAR